ncbi:Uncharacterised protein [Kocuria rosea]|nr:Uncharacterised protein [Kocuria rosea]
MGRTSAEAPAPPIVGLLAMMARAAELQGVADLGEDAHDTGYYSHFTDLLQLPQSEHSRVSMAVRRYSEDWWDSLAYWLELNDGRLGVSSAVAFSHRYVGLPVSQALVRGQDLPRLHRMFEQFQLEPGSSIGPDDMSVMLEDWVTSGGASANMRRLIANEASRAQVADIAVSELENWNPDTRESAEDGDSVSSGQVQLVYWSRRRKFTQRSLHFGGLLQTTAASGEWHLSTANDSVPLTVEPTTPTTVAFTAEDTGLEHRSLLECQLNITGPAKKTYTRIPRPIVLFSRSDSAQAFLEAPRIQLGREVSVLVRSEGNRVHRVKKILDCCAEPGYKHILGGNLSVPQGWDMFENVVLLCPPEDSQTSRGLEMLAPLTSLSIEFVGGLRLPGRLARWSYASKPELSITASTPVPISVRLEWLEVEEGEVRRLDRTLIANQAPPFTISIPEDVPCREFTVIAYQGTGKSRREVRRALRFKRGDDRDQVRWNTRPNLAHLDVGRGIMSAEPTPEEEDVVIKGARIEAYSCETDDRVVRPDLPWRNGRNSTRQHAKNAGIPLPVPDPDSCLVTGAHRFVLPPTPRKRSRRQTWTYAPCQQCGIRKRHMLDPGRSTHGNRSTSVVTIALFAELKRRPRSAVGEEELRDLMVHLGYGTFSDLRYMARDTELDVEDQYRMMRDLESSGFFEIQRDDSMRPVSWEVNDPVLLEFDEGLAAIGGWSASQLTRLEELSDGRIDAGNHQACTVVCADDLAQLADAMLPDTVYCDSGHVLLGCLPPITETFPDLPHVPVPRVHRELDWFSVTDAAWIAVDGMGGCGLYRDTSGWTTQHYLVTNDDGTCVRVDNEFGKHAAAALAGTPLVSYDSVKQELSVPLGARLPGLYERALVLSTLRLPASRMSERSLVYGNVTPRLAAALAGKLV